jgi:D-alanyl-D-alanine carboxypeptidase
VIEKLTQKPFFKTMRELLKYDKFGLNSTWQNWLEPQPVNTEPLVHQFASEIGVDSYGLHPSFDVYGGGGIASTPKDVAIFGQALFTGNLFEYQDTRNLLYHTIKTKDNKDNHYHFSIQKMLYSNPSVVSYGHGGFWGTALQYFPDLNCTISVFLMERDEWPKYKLLMEKVIEQLHLHKSKAKQ